MRWFTLAVAFTCCAKTAWTQQETAVHVSDYPSLVPTESTSIISSDVPSSVPSSAIISDVPSSTPTVLTTEIPIVLRGEVPTSSPMDALAVTDDDGLLAPSTPRGTLGTVPPEPISDVPSDQPSNEPSDAPSVVPTSLFVESAPTTIPATITWPPKEVLRTSPPEPVSFIPSDVPSKVPSDAPSVIPSDAPSSVPSNAPTGMPTSLFITRSSVPSDAPSMVPSYAPSSVPSDTPSILPSGAPSSVPSDAPSYVPSDAPSSVPSDAPSTVLSEAIPSALPSAVPTIVSTKIRQSSSTSDLPSVVPSMSTAGSIGRDVPTRSPVNSDSLSALPTIVIGNSGSSDSPNPAPETPSSVPSDAPSTVPSDAPSMVPSDAPSMVPSDAPSMVPSISVPTATTKAPTSTSISGALTNAPSDVPSMVPTLLGGEASTIDAVTFGSSVTEIMDDEQVEVFEDVVATQFLPEYLPKVYPAEYQNISCKVLNQNVVKDSNRRIQEQTGNVEIKTSAVAILMRVTSQVDLPSGVKFGDIVSQTFESYAPALQEQLSEATPYFDKPSNTSNSTNYDDDEPRFGAPIPVETSANKDEKEFPVGIFIAAAVGGAFIALVVGLIALNHRAKRTVLPTTIEDDVMNEEEDIFSVDSQAKVLANIDVRSGSAKSNYLPPTPMGTDGLPTEVGPRSAYDLEQAISPTSMGSPGSIGTDDDDDDDTDHDQSLSDNSSILGLGMTVSTVERRIETVRNLKPPIAPGSLKGTNAIKGNSKDFDDCETHKSDSSSELKGLMLVQSSSTNPHAQSEGSSDLKGLALVQTSTSSKNQTEKLEQQQEKPKSLGISARRFFGIGAVPKRQQKQPVVDKAESTDVSIDPNRAAGTPKAQSIESPSHVKMEDCEAQTPKGSFVRNNQTPFGKKFLQMNLQSAAHTGEVLQDLGKLESDWDGHLDSKASATAETPKKTNVERFRKPPKEVLYGKVLL